MQPKSPYSNFESGDLFQTRVNTNREALAEALPDLVLLVQRDGVLLSYLGGHGVEWLRLTDSCNGKPLDLVWPAAAVDLIKQMIRRAISARGTLEAELRDGDRCCELRVTAQSPDRAICIIRAASVISSDNSSAPTDSAARPNLDRRGFLRRFKNSISIAALTEGPLAVAIIHLDGIVEISRALDTKISDQVLAAATRRISAIELTPGAAQVPWYMGQLGENLLMLVLETSCRDAIEECVTRVCAILREPIELGDAEFHLAPYAGAAILGRDATVPKLLLEHAHASVTEARRSGYAHVCFFSDTLKLRSLARLDVIRELRAAIANQEIRLRYVGRHDLTTGRLVALVGYLQWLDPMRGEIRPADFLRVAEATGLSTALSRSILACLQEDFARFKSQIEPDVRISFGGLRHHVLSESFLPDINSLLAAGVVTPDRLELRIAERSYVARDVEIWRSLANLGIQLVVDEFGRQVSSLDLLARVPLWGLQLDRSWVTAVHEDPVARKVCGAVVNMALGLCVTPIATGIDNLERRQLLAELGCRQGLGDFYAIPYFTDSSTSTPAIAAGKNAAT